MSTSSRVWTAVVVGVAVVGAVWWLGRGHGDDKQGQDQAVPVSVATVRQANFVVYRTQPGTVTPANSVVVRSRVDGELTRVAFTGGQKVKRGDVLAEIDPRSFQADLQLANGDLARSQAQLANAQDTLKHYQALLSQDSIAKQRVADQEALVRQYAGEVKSGQGRIATANLQLANTRITSPLDGTVGLRRVDPGNLVGPSDARGIAVVTQSQPSKVVFSLPVNAIPPLLASLRSGACIPVDAYGDTNQAPLATGHLVAANNQVDAATGTVSLEAQFPNTDDALLPNQFVTAKVPVEVVHDALLVPAAAIQQGAQGAFVYTVKDDNTAAVAPVVVGASDANTVVVRSGLSAGAKVVTEGADRLRAGTAVHATAAPAPAQGPAEAPTCPSDQAQATKPAPNARP